MADKRQREDGSGKPIRTELGGVPQPSHQFFTPLDAHESTGHARPVRLPEVYRPVKPIPPTGQADLERNDEAHASIDLLLDVDLPVSIELGRTRMSVSELLELKAGTIVELDRLAGEPVDILVNNRPIAKGEVVVQDENFAVRITSLLPSRPRTQRAQQATSGSSNPQGGEPDPAALP